MAQRYDASKQETAKRTATGGEKYNDFVYDSFNADEVYAPTTGEYGSKGTTASVYEARQDKLGQTAQARYGQRGDAAQQAANAIGSEGERVASAEAGNAADRANALARRGGPTTDFSQANRAAGGTQATLNALNNFAGSQGSGPSAAQGQLNQATQQGLSQQLAMARSGRGFGSNSANMGQAQGAMAGVTANAANQSAQLRAQEDQAARQRQLSALSTSLGGGLGLGTQYGQQAQFDTQTALQSRGQNDAASLANNQLALANRQMGTGAALQGQQQGAQQNLGFNNLGEQTYLQRSELGQHALDQQAQYELAQQKMAMDAQIANQQADTERDSANVSMATSIFGGIFSDRHSKEKIERLEGALATSLGGKGDALETVSGAPAYAYNYKNPDQPGAKHGRMVGPMAQDLERGPLGDTVVQDTPQGKVVDTPRLTMVNSSAIAEQQKQLDALRRALGKAA